MHIPADRLEELLSVVWSEVFNIIDGEPDLDGDDAGKIATAAENAARQATLLWDHPIGNRTLEDIAKGFFPHP
jgi:hypothetical protein